MNNCLNCNIETKNPKFCSSSCSASFNNKLKPRRKPEGNCKTCAKPITTTRVYCNECFKEKSETNKINKKISKSYKVYLEENEKQLECAKCKRYLNKDMYYGKNNYFHRYCKDCLNEQTKQRLRNKKQKYLNYKGAKCNICNYDKCPGALEFHHLDPQMKDFTIASVRNTNDEEIFKELDKCILVCANCHREIHYGLISL